MFKKKKSKADLDLHSKALKKRKKHKGKSSGSRFNVVKINTKKISADSVDERLGSKTPIPLIADSATSSKKANPISSNKQSKQELMAELKALENDAYLNTLMDKLENEVSLTQKEEQDFDKMMDRLEWLMAKLEIEVDLEEETDHVEDEDEKNKFEIMHLLK